MNHKLIQWLFAKPNRYSNISYKEILDHMFGIMYQFINSCEDLDIILTKELFRINFYLFIFQNNYPTPIMNYEDSDYISTKYSSDIVDLFIDFRDMSNAYGVSLFQNDTSDRLSEFIISNCNLLNESDFIQVNDDQDKEMIEDYY